MLLLILYYKYYNTSPNTCMLHDGLILLGQHLMWFSIENVKSIKQWNPWKYMYVTKSFLFYILPHLLFTGGLGYYNNTTTFKWPILQILFCINCFVSAFCCIFCFSIKQYLALENLWYILKTFLYVTVLIFNEESLYSKSRAHRSLWVLQIHLTNWAFWPSG